MKSCLPSAPCRAGASPVFQELRFKGARGYGDPGEKQHLDAGIPEGNQTPQDREPGGKGLLVHWWDQAWARLLLSEKGKLLQKSSLPSSTQVTDADTKRRGPWETPTPPEVGLHMLQQAPGQGTIIQAMCALPMAPF